MRCEVCGRKIRSKPYKVIIEGAKLTVCADCSKHGKLTWEEEPKAKAVVQKTRAPLPTLKLQARKASQRTAEETFELVEDFDARIRLARERLGISHDDLGKRLNEKVSLLRKIETRKMKPDNKLAARLEHALKIKLIVLTTEERIPQTKIPKATSRELTLGDLIQIDDKNKNGKKKETAERRPS